MPSPYPSGLSIEEKDCLFPAKLEKLLERPEPTPGVSEEWGSGWTGPNFIVEIEETGSAAATTSDYISSHEDVTNETALNSTAAGSGPKIVVRPEEVIIVGLVLMLWVGAIVLFFNRWGKIRMLEPYQPKFQQQHRSSCPLVDMDAIPTHGRASVSRMSMGLVNNINMPTCHFAAYNPTIYAKGYAPPARLRQNSVFVGPSPNLFMMPRPPRKTRSAMDLHSMVLDEAAEQV
ncbi:PREDICTED: uncharacterized protein LOC108365991 [Rhagoletis zephyria]|uniref:uncharacterized protein LOC108365991 n=2 Tax=Rhagoletis TaxID=28609 RepID=UPI00081198C2|nr:PREDICTED: uncharacterized protein LOC108365991 [Rhagoletis zephyria]